MIITFDIGGTNVRGRAFSTGAPFSIVLADIDVTYDELQVLSRSGSADPVLAVSLLLDHIKAKNHQLSDISHVVLAVAGRTDSTGISTSIGNRGVRVDIRCVEHVLLTAGCSPKIFVINDFEAAAWGVSCMQRCDRRIIVCPAERSRFQGDTRRAIVCGPGTGLGVSCIVSSPQDKAKIVVIPSEAGNTTFAPESDHEFDFLGENRDLVRTYEDVLSARGLAALFSWHRLKAGTSHELNSSPESVCRLACEGDLLAQKAVRTFCRILGAFCGNQVLNFTCNEGVFLWGGVLQGIPDAMIKVPFSEGYFSRPRYAEFVASVPVFRVTDQLVVHKGCLQFLSRVPRPLIQPAAPR